MYVDAITMINNLNQTIPQLMQLVTAMAYVLGISMEIKGLVGLKDVAGKAGGGNGQEKSLTHCLVFLAIGSALLYLPTAIHVGTSTFWTTSPIAYEIDGGQFDVVYKLIFNVIQLIGVISFIRGLVIISQNQPASGNGPSSFTKGTTHIVGAIFLINLPALLMTLAATLGVTF